jgi:hypothetical protein
MVFRRRSAIRERLPLERPLERALIFRSPASVNVYKLGRGRFSKAGRADASL